MHSVTKRRLGATLAALALTAGGLGVAGCGSDSTTSSSATATTGTTAAADNGGDKHTGNVKLLIRPIERGVATRLSADGRAGRALAAGAGAGAGNPNGAAIPPGLPIPNGFPIPAPAR
jgi:hypothetical protein